MLKLVVFCILAVTMVVKPGTLLAAQLIAPLTYSSVGAPATTITEQESTIVHPLPHYYSALLAYKNFIKKRSTFIDLPVGYCTPSTSTFIASPFFPLSHIPPFPYSISPTYLISAPFATPFNPILKNHVPTYTGVSTIPLKIESLKSDVFNSVPKNDATINLKTEAPKYKAMSTYVGAVNMDSTNKAPIQRDSYGKPLINNPVVTDSMTKNCTYDLKAFFEDGTLICENPQKTKDFE